MKKLFALVAILAVSVATIGCGEGAKKGGAPAPTKGAETTPAPAGGEAPK